MPNRLAAYRSPPRPRGRGRPRPARGPAGRHSARGSGCPVAGCGRSAGVPPKMPWSASSPPAALIAGSSSKGSMSLTPEVNWPNATIGLDRREQCSHSHTGRVDPTVNMSPLGQANRSGRSAPGGRLGRANAGGAGAAQGPVRPGRRSSGIRRFQNRTQSAVSARRPPWPLLPAFDQPRRKAQEGCTP
jgi:hypothetical protein